MGAANAVLKSIGIFHNVVTHLCNELLVTSSHAVLGILRTLWRHMPVSYREWSVCMMTSSNGNIFRVSGPLCGEFTGHR